MPAPSLPLCNLCFDSHASCSCIRKYFYPHDLPHPQAKIAERQPRRLLRFSCTAYWLLISVRNGPVVASKSRSKISIVRWPLLFGTDAVRAIVIAWKVTFKSRNLRCRDFLEPINRVDDRLRF